MEDHNKTIQQIRKEVESIKNDFENKLNTYLRENKSISVDMDIRTERAYTDRSDGSTILNSLGVKIDYRISID